MLRAVLELDQMPAGMELFPAADESAWQLIKDVIDGSDYYVLVVGGRYGSLDETGISYTEKEYEYAVASKKPVIPLLHENPDNLPREKTETDEIAWKKLKSFRLRIEKRHTCVYWNSSEELKARVIVGLTAAMKRTPTIGWVRADKVPTEATLVEILTLRKKITELEAQVAADRTQPPKGTEDLVQGDETFDVGFSFIARKQTSMYPYSDDTSYTATINPTWDEIFAAVGPSMINETSQNELRDSFQKFLESKARFAFRKDKDLRGKGLINFNFGNHIETAIVQFRALGLIRENIRQRSVKDTKTYWTLTPYGDQLMIQLRAIRREPVSSEDESDDSSSQVMEKAAT